MRRYFFIIFDLYSAIKGFTNIVDDLINNDNVMEKKIDKLEKENKTLNDKVECAKQKNIQIEK